MSITVRPGDLRHIIEIQTNSGSRTSTGGVADNWTKHADARAAIWNWKGDEVVVNDKVTSQSYFNFRIYYISGVTEDMRIVYGSRTFEIVHIKNIEERNRVLDLVCLEIN